MNFSFYMPTKMIVGKDCVLNNTEAIASLGKKALIVTGAHSAKTNGSLDDVITVLKQNGQGFAVFDSVMSNPTVDCVYEGAHFARTEGIDFFIAIGGGSPMDATKAINLLTCQNIRPEDIFKGNFSEEFLPMAFIPTTAGTGSEVTPYAILTNDNAQTKTSISSPRLFPAISFLDAKYMMGLSKNNTVNTAIDALSHAAESMLSVKSSATTELLSIKSIALITGCFDSLLHFNLSFDDREKLLYASALAGMSIANTGTTVVHSMGYSLTYFKDINHGRANGLLLPAYLNLVEREMPELTENIVSASVFSSLSEFNAKIAQLLGKRETLSEDEIIFFSNLAIKAKNVKNSKVSPTLDDILNMYRESLA